MVKIVQIKKKRIIQPYNLLNNEKNSVNFGHSVPAHIYDVSPMAIAV